MFRFLRIPAFLFSAGLAFAQAPQPPAVLTLPPALSASGTGVIVSGGAPWGYVVWQANSPEWHDKHDVAIYLKPGNADSTLPFVLQGTMAPITDPAAIRTWIARSQRLADATNGLAENLTIVTNDAARLIQQWSPTPNPAVPVDLAARLSMLANRAKQEPGAAAALRALGQNHPVFRFIAGTGWAGPLNVPVGQDATVELREVVRATGAEGSVVGRVTVKAVAMSDPRLSPDLVTAPGAAVQVPPDWLPATPLPTVETSLAIPAPTPLPDLAPALRWSIPDELRRQILLTRGFMVWRSLGSPGTSYPGILQLLHTPPLPKKVLRDPAPASKIFSAADVATFALDRGTWFIADDNGRFDFATPSADRHATAFTGTPLISNVSHDYHVAAVDLLGRYGPPSPARASVVVHTLPPKAPRITRIENVVSGGGERLRLAIQPNKNLPGDVPATYYYIFRDRAKNTAAPEAALDRSIDPARQNEMVYVGRITPPGNPDQEAIFTDNSLVPTAPQHYGQTYFYCVRAVHETPLGLNFSPPSPAVFGTLRDREGPPAPAGSFYTEAPRATLYFAASNPAPALDPKLPENTCNLRFSFQRFDAGVSHIEIKVTSGLPGQSSSVPVQQRVLPLAHFGKGDNIVFDYPIRYERTDSITIELRPVTTAGRKGKTLTFSISLMDVSDRFGIPIHLEARSGLLMGINPEDFSWWFNYFRRANSASSVASFTPARAADGTWTATFPGTVDNTRARSLLIQSKPVSGSVWTNLTTARLAAGSLAFHFHTAAALPNTQFRVWEVMDPADDVVPPFPLHLPLGGSPKVISPLRISLVLPVGAKEYRLYRRIDDGPLFLLKQDTGTWDSATVKTTVFDDGMIPPAGGTISYFGQCFDEHGNPGPLALLDQKVGIIPDLPIPVVDALTSAGNSADPLMVIKASCPSPGVRQMEVKITPDPEPTSGLTSTTKPSGMLYNFTPGAEVTQPQPYDKTLLSTAAIVLPPSQPLIYSQSVRIKQGVEYIFQIRALGANGAEGPWSAEQKFTWTSPLIAAAVPWPARPLPTVQVWNPNVEAFLTTPISYHVSAAPSLSVRPLRMLSPRGGLSQTFPTGGSNGFPDHKRSQLGVAVEIGRVRLTTANADDPNANWEVSGITQGVSGTIYRYGSLAIDNLPGFNGTTGPDNLWESQLHRKEKMQGDIPTFDFERRPLPVVLYRQQTSRTLAGVTTTPITNADIVQVSPMIDTIAWRTLSGRSVLVDPYVRAVRRFSIDGAEPVLSLVIYDTAPVTAGATYAYYLVHFSPEGEPDLIHPCGPIFIPGTP